MSSIKGTHYYIFPAQEILGHARMQQGEQGHAPDLARGWQAAGEPRMGSCET